MTGGEINNRIVSPFVSAVLKRQPGVLTSTLPEITDEVRKAVAAITGRDLADEAATRDLIAKYVRSAPPPSTWDQPDPDSCIYNRFGRRDGPGKMARGIEYWNSEYDDYALPDANGGSSYNMGPPRGFTSIASAKSLLRQPQAPAAPKPPPVKLKSSNYDLPGPVPFTFGGREEQKAADLTSFTSSANSGLAAMKSLGMDLAEPESKPQGRPVSSALGGRTAGATGSSVLLARGTKRLGMGRAPSSWGAKKAKQ